MIVWQSHVYFSRLVFPASLKVVLINNPLERVNSWCDDNDADFEMIVAELEKAIADSFSYKK